ncbi:transposase, partial [Kingella kingae]|nr:transposase [Kingella kingae]MBD3633277.1 transposase [Kingella kingae]MBD3660582.1 transposase [Kingella kingae]
PKRWIVERTFAWLGWSGRLAKDFEQTNLSAENFVKLGAIDNSKKRGKGYKILFPHNHPKPLPCPETRLQMK